MGDINGAGNFTQARTIHKYQDEGYLEDGIRFYNAACGSILTIPATFTEIWGRVTCSDCLEVGGYERLPVPENRRRDAVMATREKYES